MSKHPFSGHGELWDVLVDDTPPTVDRRVAWSQQLLSALAELQRSAIIHRDLNPWNLFLSSEQPRAVKLGDFGAVMSTLPPKPPPNPQKKEDWISMLPTCRTC